MRFITSSFWFSFTPPFIFIVFFVSLAILGPIIDGESPYAENELETTLFYVSAIGVPLSFFVFLPSIIARTRNHPRKSTIFWMNLFL